MKPMIETTHPYDKLLNTERFPHIWCPGCGLGKVLSAYTQAITKSGISPDKHAVVSGIGCTGRSAGYVNVDSYHTTHGRAIAFATGLKLANKDLTVTVISGDGDLSTIGGNHLIHAARRNINLNIILVNNFNYGMTGGQASATTPYGAKTTTTRNGNYEHGFNLPELMKGAGASHVSRWTILHIRQLQQTILDAFNHDGFSFIEVISPCPKGFGKKNGFREGIDQMRYFEEKSKVQYEIELQQTRIQIPEDIIVGEFVKENRPSLEKSREKFLGGR